ncbi:hypothetical protein NON20_11505 [Synechocystis sp. B12]|nr:hypothetical protein NON20_11505 [Synechocystis sp. B12]
MIAEALSLRGVSTFTTVKGLEGSCDLPQERTAIIGLYDLTKAENALTRLRLHAADFGLGGKIRSGLIWLIILSWLKPL